MAVVEVAAALEAAAQVAKPEAVRGLANREEWW